jgi:hypothetical protein
MERWKWMNWFDSVTGVVIITVGDGFRVDYFKNVLDLVVSRVRHSWWSEGLDVGVV